MPIEVHDGGQDVLKKPQAPDLFESLFAHVDRQNCIAVVSEIHALLCLIERRRLPRLFPRNIDLVFARFRQVSELWK